MRGQMCESAAWMHHGHPLEMAEAEWDPDLAIRNGKLRK
jgi:hypothetical protein